MKEKLEKRINLRLSIAEYNLISREKSRTNLSMSEYLRQIIFSKKINFSKKNEIKRFDFFLLHYAKFGNNINQIAKVLNIQLKNSGELHLSKSEMDSIAILKEVIQQWNQILKTNKIDDYIKSVEDDI